MRRVAAPGCAEVDRQAAEVVHQAVADSARREVAVLVLVVVVSLVLAVPGRRVAQVRASAPAIAAADCRRARLQPGVRRLLDDGQPRGPRRRVSPPVR